MTEEHREFNRHLLEQARDGYGVSVERPDTEQKRNINRPMNAWIRSTRAAEETDQE